MLTHFTVKCENILISHESSLLNRRYFKERWRISLDGSHDRT